MRPRGGRSVKRAFVAVAIAVLSLALANDLAAASTVIVGTGGYATINQAIAAALPDDVIRIHAGVYREQVILDKAVTLDAFGDGPVWIDGGCASQNGIQITGDGATVTNIGVKRTYEAGIGVSAADDVTLDRLTIQDYNCADLADQYRAGIAAWFGSTHLTITNSTITRRVELAGPQTGYGNGIWIKNTSLLEGGGHYIAANTIVGGYDGIGGEPEDALYGSFYRDTTIEQNNVTDCWDDGIQVEGGDINITVRQNTIERCAIGIAFAPNLLGPLYIQQNLILDLQVGEHGARYAFKIGDSSAGTTYIEDNIVITEGDGVKQSNPIVGPIVSRRNAIQVSGRVIEIQSPIPPGTSFDEDCLWTSDPDRFIEWQSEMYLSLSAFATATGQEANGIESPDCVAIPSPTPTLPPDEDADGDGLLNGLEYGCGSDPLDASSQPELVGGPFAGVDEDLNAGADEPLPAGAGSFDCDRDGFTGDAEVHIMSGFGGLDQDPCGLGDWPLDIDDGSPPNSANRVNIRDLQTFVLPTYRLATKPGDPAFDVRWDVVPGAGGPFSSHINLVDISKVAFDRPPMLGGAVAFGGPSCPWPP